MRPYIAVWPATREPDEDTGEPNDEYFGPFDDYESAQAFAQQLRHTHDNAGWRLIRLEEPDGDVAQVALGHQPPPRL